MPYLSQLDLTRARTAYRGLGQTAPGGPTGDPRGGTAAEWEAYRSRIRWRRVEAQTGPRGKEWARQATWSAQALQKLIAGESIPLPPFPSDPELLALIVNGRAWLLTMPEWELRELFPDLTSAALARARRLLLPGRDVVRIVRAKLEADAEKFAADAERLGALRGELARYEKFANDTLQQFQAYIDWFKRHQEKKEKRTKVVSRALTAIAAALYWVPVVGWVLGAAVDAANIAMQLDRMKDGIEAMQAAGLRVQAGRVYVALQEALIQAIAEVEVARDEAAWMLMLTREQIGLLDAIGRPAAGGAQQPTGIAPPGAAPTAAVPDASIVGALRAEASRALRTVARAPGRLLGALAVAAAAAVAVFGRKKRRA